MYKKLFFIEISFTTFFNHAMISDYNPYTLDNMPWEILKEIVDSNGIVSQKDVTLNNAYQYCKSLGESFGPSKNSERLTNKITVNENLLNKDAPIKAYLKNIATLSQVNTKLNDTLKQFKTYQKIFDENILLCPTNFHQFNVDVMDIKGRFTLYEPNTYEPSPFNHKLYIYSYITLRKRTSTSSRIEYIFPIIKIDLQIFCPIQEYTTYHAEETNTPIAPAIRTLELAFKTHKTTIFENINILFSIISQEAFSKDRLSQKKINAFLVLCKYAYDHFDQHNQDHSDDLSYIEEKKKFTFTNCWGFSMGETTLTFNFGSMHESCLPIKLIKDLLEVNID